MSKSAIYTTNTTGATVPVDGIIPVGNTTRRYGCNIKQDGHACTRPPITCILFIFIIAYDA